MYTKAIEIHRENIKRFPILLADALMRYFGGQDPDWDFAIPHQTSIRAVDAGMQEWSEYAKRNSSYLKRPVPEILYSLQEYGNTASTSHFVVLYDGLREKRIKEGSKVLFLSFASGIVIGLLFATIGKLGCSQWE
jgi:3-oxoacyl-[acyl-carrier-protein] synthase-3